MWWMLHPHRLDVSAPLAALPSMPQACYAGCSAQLPTAWMMAVQECHCHRRRCHRRHHRCFGPPVLALLAWQLLPCSCLMMMLMLMLMRSAPVSVTTRLWTRRLRLQFEVALVCWHAGLESPKHSRECARSATTAGHQVAARQLLKLCVVASWQQHPL